MMKLAEALMERSDLKTRIEQLAARLNENAKVQEGDEPAENPAELLDEINRLYARLERLMTLVNLTNARTLSDGEPLTALLARRDCLSGRIRQLRDFLACASANVSRGTRAEIRVVSTVNVKEYQKRADDLARDLRELDVKIQSLNWTTDLMEA